MVSVDFKQNMKALDQRFSIRFVARIPSGRKNHFCTPCTIWCIVFCIIIADNNSRKSQ